VAGDYKEADFIHKKMADTYACSGKYEPFFISLSDF
jgi:hypothetical protein